jgi:CRISP-associated protein Cas1
LGIFILCRQMPLLLGAARMFQRMTELSMLEAAWEKVRRNGGGCGGDGVRLTDYREDLALRLIRLQRDLQFGSYAPGPMRTLHVPKRQGGTRRLAIPCINDRVAQTAAALVLGPVLNAEMEDSSYGYRPGRSVRQAVARVAAHRRNGFGWVVDGDIERYFDTVPHDRLLQRLARSVDDAQLIDLVTLWLESYSAEGLGLPQGAPISPLLANLYLDDIDERIAGKGVRLVRFADDFLLMCRSEMAAERARDTITALLAEHGLRLNAEKTRIVPFEQGFRFLGHLFVRAIVVKELDDAPLDPAELAAQLSAHPADAPEGETDAHDEAQRHDGSPGLRVLYVFEPGRRLTHHNDALMVTEPGGTPLLALPAHRVDRVELGPDVEVSAEALRIAVGNGISVALVNGLGGTVAQIEGRPGERAARQLEQARHSLEAPLRLDLARRFVQGRIRNQRALLRRVNQQRKPKIVAVEQALTAINPLLRKTQVAKDVPGLLGLEGAVAALYWPAFSQLLLHGWTLPARRRQPPPDPVNLFLSFLSTLLHRDMEVLVGRHGLHAGFGVLHGAVDFQPGCVSDLIEEFRAPLVEGLVLYLLNNRIVTQAMVVETDIAGTQAWRLTPAGRNALVRGYEAWLDRPVKSPRTGLRGPWRRVMDDQVSLLVDHIEGRAPYQPYTLDY